MGSKHTWLVTGEGVRESIRKNHIPAALMLGSKPKQFVNALLGWLEDVLVISHSGYLTLKNLCIAIERSAGETPGEHYGTQDVCHFISNVSSLTNSVRLG